MTVGLSITNNMGEMLINADFRHPYCIARFTFGPSQYSVVLKGIGLLSRHNVIGSMPGESGNYIRFLEIPNDGRWYQLTESFLYVISPSGVPPTEMKNVYLFSTLQANPTTGAGLQMFDSTGALTYDSNLKHLHLSGVLNAGIFNLTSSGGARLIKGAMPNTPAFAVTNYTEETARASGSSSTVITREGFWLFDGSVLQGRLFATDTDYVDAAWNYLHSWGYSEAQSIAVIDATQYF